MHVAVDDVVARRHGDRAKSAVVARDAAEPGVVMNADAELAKFGVVRPFSGLMDHDVEPDGAAIRRPEDVEKPALHPAGVHLAEDVQHAEGAGASHYRSLRRVPERARQQYRAAGHLRDRAGHARPGRPVQPECRNEHGRCAGGNGDDEHE